MRNAAVALLLLLLSFLTYSNSLHNDFLLDDHGLILQATEIRNAQLLYRNFLVDEDQVYYRPIPHTLIMLNYLMFQDEPFGYHLVNLILFTLSCFLLYAFLCCLIKDWRVALLASMLFAVHPINGMLINYNTATGYSVLVGFMVLGLWSCLFALDRKDRKIFYMFSLLCFVAALLCHETAVAFPLYLASTLFFVRKMDFKKVALISAPFLLVLAGYALFRWQYASFKVGIIDKIPSLEMGFFNYTATFAELMLWYISKLFFLRGIVLIWVTPMITQHLLWWNLGFAGIMGAAVFVIWRFWKCDVKSMALSWFFIGFVPVGLACLFQPQLGFTIEPHWLFFSSIGFFVLAAILMFKIKEHINSKIWRVSLVLVFAALIMQSRHYNNLWGNEKEYCRYWLKVVPGYKSVMFYLAGAYMRDGEYAEAKKLYREALANSYDDWQIYTNLGLIERELNDSSAAARYFQEAFKANPASGLVHNNLGTIAIEEGDPARAEDFFTKAIALEPYLLEPRLNLAGLYAEAGRWPEAIALLNQNRKINPDDQRTKRMLLELYLSSGEKPQALKFAEEVLARSKNVQELVDVGGLLASRGLTKAAEVFFFKAMDLDPSRPEVYLEVGKLYGNRGEFSMAMSLWREGMKRNPEDPRFEPLMEQARQLGGTPEQD